MNIPEFASYEFSVGKRKYKVHFRHAYYETFGENEFRHVVYATITTLNKGHFVYVGAAITNPVDKHDFTRGCWHAFRRAAVGMAMQLGASKKTAKHLSKLYSNALYKVINEEEENKEEN